MIYLHLSEPFHACMSAASRVICVALMGICGIPFKEDPTQRASLLLFECVFALMRTGIVHPSFTWQSII